MVIEAAIRAALDGCNVLIGSPLGVLVAQYRSRLPPGQEIVVETIHSAFRVTRKRDEAYVPPGRLRHYDLIILDEVSQIDCHVWATLQTALSELAPYPYVVFVCDFQQLQPIDGRDLLFKSLETLRSNGKLSWVELQQHEAARSNDPQLLGFLQECRTRQPTRERLTSFFHNLIIPNIPYTTHRQTIMIPPTIHHHPPTVHARPINKQSTRH